jgi:hypothetical protein
MAKTLLLLCCGCTMAQSRPFASSAQHEVISGDIVAYSNGLVCLNGNSYWSLIIHVWHPKDVATEFIKVDLSLACEDSPKWLSARPAITNFRLIHEKESDVILREFLDSEDPTTGKKTNQNPSLPIWKRVPGTENEKLPFGQTVRGYRSLDLPLAPLF